MNLNPISQLSFSTSFTQATSFFALSLTRRITIVAGAALAILGIAFLVCYNYMWKKKESENEKLIKQLAAIKMAPVEEPSSPKDAPPAKEVPPPVQEAKVEKSQEQAPVTPPSQTSDVKETIEKTEEVAQKTIPVPTLAPEPAPQPVNVTPPVEKSAPIEQPKKVVETPKPKSREEILEEAFKLWKLNHWETRTANFQELKDHLKALSTSGHEEEYFNFIALIFEKIKDEKLENSFSDNLLNNVSNLFSFTLTAEQFGELTKIILKHAKSPWDILQVLILLCRRNENKEKINKILDEGLPLLDDGANLAKLYESIWYKDWSDLCKKLSLPQIGKLIQHWKSTSLEDKKLFYRLYDIFKDRDDQKDLIEIYVRNGIDLAELIKHLSSETNEQIKSIDVCSWAILRILNSTDSEDAKREQIKGLLNLLNSFKNEHQAVAAFLAEKCTPEHMQTVVMSIRMCTKKQAVVEQFLYTLLCRQQPDLAKIRNAFVAYWTCWQEFFTAWPKPEWVVLGYMRNEAVLQAVYEAIPSDDAAKRQEIINHMRTNHPYNNFGLHQDYHLGVEQEVIDRVLGPIPANIPDDESDSDDETPKQTASY